MTRPPPLIILSPLNAVAPMGGHRTYGFSIRPRCTAHLEAIPWLHHLRYVEDAFVRHLADMQQPQHAFSQVQESAKGAHALHHALAHIATLRHAGGTSGT